MHLRHVLGEQLGSGYSVHGAFGIHGFQILGEPELIWLVVSTPLKNISQIGSSSQLMGKIQHV